MDRNYAHRTSAQKFGINPGDEVTVLNPPEDYLKLINLANISITYTLPPVTYFIHYFAYSKSQLEKDFPKLKKHLSKDGLLWISNKKGVKDFNQEDVQKIGLENGLVDVKVASLNDDWSAMKFVYRIKDR